MDKTDKKKLDCVYMAQPLEFYHMFIQQWVLKHQYNKQIKESNSTGRKLVIGRYVSFAHFVSKTV